MFRIKQPIHSLWTVLLGVAGILALTVGYWLLSDYQHSKNHLDTTIPSFSQLWDGWQQMISPREHSLRSVFGLEEEEKDSWDWFTSTWLCNDLTATYGRLIQGMLYGCLLSVLFGILMGCYEPVAALLSPALSFLTKVPGTAMLAVFFVLVGIGENMFIAMIAFGVLPTLTQAIYLSAKHDLHEEEIHKAYTLGASNIEVIYDVVYKQILPKIIENIRLQLGPAMVCLIAAEMLDGQVGVGFRIRMEQRQLHMNVVYNYLFILGMTGLLMDQGMLIVRRRLCPWYSRYR